MMDWATYVLMHDKVTLFSKFTSDGIVYVKLNGKFCTELPEKFTGIAIREAGRFYLNGFIVDEGEFWWNCTGPGCIWSTYLRMHYGH